MRIGLMVGPERGRYADQGRAHARRRPVGRGGGPRLVWIPQIPDEFDALTAATLIGAATDRIEIGTAVVPIQPRHPIALAQQALSTQAVCEGRLALGLGVSHHWIVDDMLGLPYERPAADHARLPRRARPGPRRAGPGRRGERALPGPQPPRHHRRRADPGAARRPRPGDAADRGRAHRRHHPLDGRRAGHRRPRRPPPHQGGRGGGPARAPHRRRRPGLPVPATTRSTSPSRGPTGSWPRPRPRPTTSACSTHGDAQQVGDLLAAGSEAAVEKRLRSFADAGRHRPLDPGRADRRGPRRSCSRRRDRTRATSPPSPSSL